LKKIKKNWSCKSNWYWIDMKLNIPQPQSCKRRLQSLSLKNLVTAWRPRPTAHRQRPSPPSRPPTTPAQCCRRPCPPCPPRSCPPTSPPTPRTPSTQPTRCSRHTAKCSRPSSSASATRPPPPARSRTAEIGNCYLKTKSITNYFYTIYINNCVYTK